MPKPATTECALKGCHKPADPEIVHVHADQRVVQFCCAEHLRLWAGFEDKSGKVDARAY